MFYFSNMMLQLSSVDSIAEEACRPVAEPVVGRRFNLYRPWKDSGNASRYYVVLHDLSSCSGSGSQKICAKLARRYMGIVSEMARLFKSSDALIKLFLIKYCLMNLTKKGFCIQYCSASGSYMNRICWCYSQA